MKKYIFRNLDYILFFALLLLGCTQSCRAYEVGRFVLKGKVESDLIDTLILHVWDDIVTYDLIYDEPHRNLIVPLQNGSFEIAVDSIADVSIISLSSGRLNGLPIALLDQYYVCKDDSISIDIRLEDLDSRLKVDDTGKSIGKYSFSFTGKGSEKFNCRYRLHALHKELQHQPLPLPAGEVSKWVSDSLYFQKAERITHAEIDFLDEYKRVIDPVVYWAMRADIIGGNTYVFLFKKLFLAARMYVDDPEKLRKVKALFEHSELLRRMKVENNLDVVRSSVFTQALVYKARVEEMLFHTEPSAYERLKSIDNPRVRERALTNYLIHHYVRIPNERAKKVLKDALLYVADTDYLKLLHKLEQTDQGQFIPSFTLYDMSETEIDLRSFMGKVLFVDFFYTGCSNCVGYFKKTVSKAEKYFEDNDEVVFVTVSIDGNKEKWINSVKSGNYTSLQAVNLYTGGVGERHPIISHFNVFGYPKPLLISRDGRIISTDFHELGRTEPGMLIRTIEEALRTGE